MATFLDDLSIYNAKAAAAITLAATTGDSGKANLMSSLKSTANDTSLTDAVRLNALTALINVGNLLDIPLPPYFPITTTFANTQTYTGLHNDLIGLDVEPYLHITTAEKSFYANKANLSDISFTNLIGAYTSNAGLTAAINAKQNALNGTGFVKASGGTITYDNSTYLTSISGISASGDLDGTYPNPTLRNTSVTGQALTGFNGSASTGTITGADTILSAFETLNANVNNVIATSGTITSVSFALPSSVFSYTAGPFTSGAANLSGSFVNQSQNRFFAGPSSGGSGQPSFRAIVAGDFPASGATAGSYGSSSSIPVITVDTYGRVTNIFSVASASGGQVNTVDLSAPGIFNTTTAGTTDVLLTLGLETQIANTVWAGPASGVDATPGFRSLVALDIPEIAISQVTNLQNELDSKMTFLLNDGEIWIGNASNAPTNKSLTGDVTMTREGVVTISGESVTFSKMQNITSGNLLGRWDASTPGDIQQITLDPLSFSLNSGTGVLSLATPPTPILNSKGGLITYRQSIGQSVQLPAVFEGKLLLTDSAEEDGLKWVTAQGDIEVDDALDGTFNILPGAVTLGKMATLPAFRVIGNDTSGALPPKALTKTELTTLIEQFNASASGVVPASGGVGATYYLNANGGWTVPAGGGGTTTNALTINNSGSGDASGSTFNGSSPITISYNSIGAQASSANLTSLAALSYASTAFVKMTGANTFSLDDTTYLSGTVSLANGGTNANNTAINGGVAYSTASAINITAAGTLGQILKSNGAAAPTWTTATYPSTTTKDKILVSTADDVVGQIDAPTSNNTFLKWNAGVFSWATAGSGSGTVTSGNQYQLAYYNGAGSTTSVTGLTSITASCALVSDANGLPVASSVSTTQLQYLSSATGTTGTTITNLVFSTSPTLITPTLGVASATSINKVAITAPATSATLTIADGKTLTINESLTLSASSSASVAFGAGGTVAYVGLANSWTSGIKQTFAPSATTAGINVGTLAGQPSSPANGDLVYNSTATALQAYINSAWVSLGSGGGGSGTVNPGAQFGVAYYPNAAGGTVVDDITPPTTNGTYVLTSVVTASAAVLPTWAVLSTTATLTNLGAATASNTPLSNAANSTITWNWNSNTTSSAFVLGSTGLTTASLLTLTHTTSALTGNLASFTSSSVSSGTLLNLGITGTGASAKNLVITNASTGNTSGRGIDVLISGTTASATTYGAYISNTKLTGTAAYALYLNTSATATTNYGLQVNASGGTTNYAIDVVAGISRFGVGTASVPQLILTPSSAITISGTVNGSIWYDTASSNSSLTLYKDSAYTKILTTARNPDFVSSAQGVVVADASGNFTKSADLTALGIYASYNSVTVPGTTIAATTLISTSLVGSKTLPISFFALGKTIEFKTSGIYTLAGTNQLTLRVALGGTLNIDVVLDHGNAVTSQYFEYVCQITCVAISGTNSTYNYSARAIGQTTSGVNSGANIIYGTAANSGSIAINTGATIATDVLAFFDASAAGNSVISYQATAIYLN